MSELRVPTIALDAEIVCGDGTWFAGRIFLPAASSHHSGAMRPDEWMNDSTPFFPFLPANSAAPVILNKAEVVVLSVVVEGSLEEEVSRARIGGFRWSARSASCLACS